MSKLFGTSPFRPLQEHMIKTRECVDILPDLIEAFVQGDQDRIMELKFMVSRLEHEADEIKNAIRDHLPKSLFLPVNRGDFMAVLKVQDRFADTVEDITILMTLRETKFPAFLQPALTRFVEKVLESFYLADEIMSSMSSLIASSFSGPECQKILEKINKLGHLEWEADILQIELARELFKHETDIDVMTIYFLNEIFKNLGSIANHAESIGDRMRVMLA
ncbi:TIGR00153 family protein [bacterium]|nr:TIGR00153 family protein [candidate division CSSED10-310 bacterium]